MMIGISWARRAGPKAKKPLDRTQKRDGRRVDPATKDGLQAINHQSRSSNRRLPVVEPDKCLPSVALLTAGRDRPYALGLAAALAGAGVCFDFIGSNDVDSPELHGNPRINYFNLRGDQNADAGLSSKIVRVLAYYCRLIAYAAAAKPKLFHILWNNKIELFDRTLLMLYYKLLGKKIVLTAHNVNIGRRDGTNTWLNFHTLKFQYHLCEHIFVHTAKMKAELVSEFGISGDRVQVIPFGVNRTVPDTAMTTQEARQRLGLAPDHKVILFFGFIAPYKGLEYLIDAFTQMIRPAGGGSETGRGKAHAEFRLLVAGRPKGSGEFWSALKDKIERSPACDQIILKTGYVPDADTEIYFKAADVLVLPYTQIFQSGVLLLGYGFGLPVIAADVGSLGEEIVEGKTGFVFPPRDTEVLAKVLISYFAGDLYRNLEQRRRDIRNHADEHYSWDRVASITTQVYAKLNAA